jgi:hypothetical protein
MLDRDISMKLFKKRKKEKKRRDKLHKCFAQHCIEKEREKKTAPNYINALLCTALKTKGRKNVASDGINACSALH